MSERPETQLAPPDCPRCGYDLRATVSTWTDRCPLEGRCSECGLEFVWTEVFDPLSRTPTWCLEYAPRVRLLDATVRTLCALLAPWWFWRRLRLSMPIRWHRLAILPVLVLVVIPWLVLVGGQVDLAIRTWNELIRVGGGTTDVTLPRAVARTIMLPLSDASPGSIPQPRPTRAQGLVVGPYPYPSPWKTLFYGSGPLTTGSYINGTIRRAIHLRSSGVPRDWSAVAWFGPIQATGGLLTLAGLPQTRRRARVRGRHLGRIAAYTTPILLFLIAVPLLLAFTLGDTPWVHPIPRAAVLIGGPTLLLTAWWPAVTRHHLRLPHAPGVAAAALTVGTLLAALVLVGPLGRVSLWF